ncbi:MAG: metallophosphoesterase family protein [Anaerolineales bacterium]
MRIAIFSDIHGNCLALETVLTDIKQTQIDSLVCLGDAIQGGAQPSETVALLRNLDCPTVMGNSDDWLLTGKTIESLSPLQYEIRDWSLSKLSEDDCKFISQFPSTIEIELGRNKRLLCFHGSPKSYYNNILPTTSDSELQELLGDNQSFIYTGGHVHSQLLRRIGDTFYFRPGSVGFVYDRNRMNADFRLDAWAEYAILNATNAQFSIEFRRIPIDVEKVKKIWLNSGRPDAERQASLYYQE